MFLSCVGGFYKTSYKLQCNGADQFALLHREQALIGEGPVYVERADLLQLLGDHLALLRRQEVLVCFLEALKYQIHEFSLLDHVKSLFEDGGLDGLGEVLDFKSYKQRGLVSFSRAYLLT